MINNSKHSGGLVTELCLTLVTLVTIVDYTPPGSSVHGIGIFQAGILE